MPATSEKNKKIIKNTLALYFRQIIVMIVALFTSRIVLQTLGVTDYGINNVVGGVVAMFSFISGTLMGITQRFISVELGKGGDLDILRKIFSTSLILHFIAAVIVVIIAETLGLWFLNNKLVIPAERMIAANWVFQFAVFGFVLTMLNAPLTALIIAHEDMHIYGYMGIFDVFVRLVTVYLLVIVSGDKLILFGLFGFIVTCMVWIFYFIYCKRKYQEAKFSLVYDKSLVRELTGFGGYIFTNNIFMILLEHGRNIMINIFFGPSVNTAKGLANSINSALLSFGNNFRVTLSPQIIMAYSSNNHDFMWSLVERGTRIMFFLYFVFSLPILLETEFILKLWLKNVHEYTSIFIKLLLINSLTLNFFSTFWTVISASGKLGIMYCLCYISYFIILLFSYISCKIGYPPQYIFILHFFVGFVIFSPIILLLAKKHYNFPVKYFFIKAISPIFIVSFLSIIPFLLIKNVIISSFKISILIIVTNIIWTCLIITIFGINKNERLNIKFYINSKINILKSFIKLV